MKKILIFLIVFILLIACLSSYAYAEDTEETAAEGDKTVSESEEAVAQGKEEAVTEGEETSANGEEEALSEVPLKEYIKDRIIPVVVGVLTSAVAVITTLSQVLKGVKSLKDSKDLLEDSKEQIKTVSKSTEGQIAEIKDSIKELLPLFEEISYLKEAIEKYKGEIGTLEHILTLAYSADEKLVRSGKAKEMALLLAKVGEGVTNGEEEA